MKDKINLVLYIALFLISLPAAIPLILPGFYEPHDLHHLADIYEMYRAFISGQLPPRLGPDFSFGFGYPLFNFYYLAPFYLGALFFATFGSLQLSLKLVFLLCIFVGVYAMYLFLKQFTDKYAAFAGSLLFLYTPYRTVQIYIRGAIGEAFALTLFPLVLYFLVKLIQEKQSKKFIAFSSLTLALFILSHNYFWALSLIWIVFLILSLIKKEQRQEAIKKLFIAGLISIGLTSYWWVPALIENKLVASATPFPLADHFPFIKQLIIPSWGYGSSVWGAGDEISFQIGLMNLLVVAVALVLLTIRKFKVNQKLRILSVWAFVGFFINVVFMNSRTLFLWQLIPFYDFIQFPWRLLAFTTFFSSVLLAVVINLIPKKVTQIIVPVVILLTIVITINYFKPSQIVDKSDDYYLDRFFNDATYSEDYLLLPNWTEQRPMQKPQNKIESNTAKIVNLTKKSLVSWQANVEAANEATVIFNSYYFPGWNAKLDQNDIDIQKGKPFGQIEVIVPPGEHVIEFYWQETPLRRVADFVSLFFVVVIGGLIYQAKHEENPERKK